MNPSIWHIMMMAPNHRLAHSAYRIRKSDEPVASRINYERRENSMYKYPNMKKVSF